MVVVSSRRTATPPRIAVAEHQVLPACSTTCEIPAFSVLEFREKPILGAFHAEKKWNIFSKKPSAKFQNRRFLEFRRIRDDKQTREIPAFSASWNFAKAGLKKKKIPASACKDQHGGIGKCSKFQLFHRLGISRLLPWKSSDSNLILP